MNNFYPSVGLQEAIPAASRAAGSTDINCATIDRKTSQAECIGLNLEMGAIVAGAVTSFKWQGCADGDDTSVAANWHDLAGTKIDIADDDDDGYFWSELRTPVYRYVRAVVERVTQNAAIRSALYVLGSTRQKLDFFGDDWEEHKVFLAPEAGTA